MSVGDILFRTLVSSVVSSGVRKGFYSSKGFSQGFYDKNRVSRCPDCFGIYSQINCCPLCNIELKPLYYERKHYNNERDYDGDGGYSE